MLTSSIERPLTESKNFALHRYVNVNFKSKQKHIICFKYTIHHSFVFEFCNSKCIMTVKKFTDYLINLN